MKSKMADKVISHFAKRVNKKFNTTKALKFLKISESAVNSLLSRMYLDGLLHRLKQGNYELTEKALELVPAEQIKSERKRRIIAPEKYDIMVARAFACITQFAELIERVKGNVPSEEIRKLIKNNKVNGSLITHAVRLGLFKRHHKGIYEVIEQNITKEHAKKLIDERKVLVKKKTQKEIQSELEFEPQSTFEIEPIKNRQSKSKIDLANHTFILINGGKILSSYEHLGMASYSAKVLTEKGHKQVCVAKVIRRFEKTVNEIIVD